MVDVAEIPDYRWDLALRTGPSMSTGSMLDETREPDYQWEQHSKPFRRRRLQRVFSDVTDYAPRMPIRSSFGSKKKQTSKPEEATTTIATGFNWVTKKSTKLTRSRSDLTEYDRPKSLKRRGKRPRVRFSKQEPQFIEIPSLTDEDKAELYWSREEIRSFRQDKDRERDEQVREKQEQAYERQARRANMGGSNSLNSFWGSKKDPGQLEKERAEKAQREAEKKKKQEEDAAKVAAQVEMLQLAMQQAQMVTGY